MIPRKAQKAWRHLARELGLRFQPVSGALRLTGIRLHGAVGGQPIDAEIAPDGAAAWLQHVPDAATQQHIPALQGQWLDMSEWTDSAIRVRTPIRPPLPKGLRIRHETRLSEGLKYAGIDDLQLDEHLLDDRLLVKARARGEALAFLKRPEILAQLRRFVIFEEGSLLNQGGVTLYRLGHSAEAVREAVATASAIALAFEQAAEADWLAVAGARGLRLMGYDERGHRAMRGRIGQADLKIGVVGSRLLRREYTLLCAELPAMPWPLEIGGSSELPRVRTGNPILDRQVAIHSTRGEWAEALFADPEVTGAVMGVFHAWPGATWRSSDGGPDILEMTSPGKLDRDRLDAMIDAALALHLALWARR